MNRRNNSASDVGGPTSAKERSTACSNRDCTGIPLDANIGLVPPQAEFCKKTSGGGGPLRPGIWRPRVFFFLTRPPPHPLTTPNPHPSSRPQPPRARAPPLLQP